MEISMTADKDYSAILLGMKLRKGTNKNKTYTKVVLNKKEQELLPKVLTAGVIHEIKFCHPGKESLFIIGETKLAVESVVHYC